MHTPNYQPLPIAFMAIQLLGIWSTFHKAKQIVSHLSPAPKAADIKTICNMIVYSGTFPHKNWCIAPPTPPPQLAKGGDLISFY